MCKVIKDTTQKTLQGFTNLVRKPDAPVFTDEHSGYQGLTNHHSVCHSKNQWTVSTLLDGLAHTNGVESFWAALKRIFHGVYHHMSKKHLGRYSSQFAGKHNMRPMDTADQMGKIVRSMVGKRLRYADLIAKPVLVEESAYASRPRF